MLKKFVSGIVGAALTFSMLGVAAAEGLSVTSTTIHKDGGQIDVTTVVTGVKTNDTITLMAHKGDLANVDENAIVYIDQYDSIQENESLTKTYTIKGEDATGVRVSVGGRRADTGIEASKDNAVTEQVEVTVKGASESEYTKSINKPRADELVELPDLTLSKLVASVEKGDSQPVDEGQWVQSGTKLKVSGALLQENVTLTVKYVESQKEETGIATEGMGFISNDTTGDAAGANSVLGMGQLTRLNPEDINNEYGIAFASTLEGLTQNDGANAKKYKALGCGSDGLYAVKLQDISKFEDLKAGDDGCLYCCAYVVTGTDSKTYKVGGIYKVKVDASPAAGMTRVERGVPVVEVPGPAMDEVAVDVGPSAE